jgi:hypothetical protein
MSMAERENEGLYSRVAALSHSTARNAVLCKLMGITFGLSGIVGVFW